MEVLFQFVTVVDHTRERRVVLQYAVHALVIGLGREVEPPAGRFGEVAERRMMGMLRRRASGRRHPEVGGEADVRRGDFVDVLRDIVVGGPQPAAACNLPVEREARLGRGVAVGGDSPVSLQEIEPVAQCGVAREAVRQRNRRGQEGRQFVRVVARPPVRRRRSLRSRRRCAAGGCSGRHIADLRPVAGGRCANGCCVCIPGRRSTRALGPKYPSWRRSDGCRDANSRVRSPCASWAKVRCAAWPTRRRHTIAAARRATLRCR